jgi:uncharacterized membrane protein YdfJ with MMPL/SSD domain
MGNGVTRRFTDVVLRRRRAVAAVWLALTVAGMWAAATLSDHLSARFDAPDRPAFAANEQLLTRYGTGGPIAPIVVVARGGTPDARGPRCGASPPRCPPPGRRPAVPR